MSKQLFYLISFVLVLSMAGSTSADLVANWRFDEGSGTTAVDISGNGHNGTINGTPNWVVGMSGSALEFDGDDYVDIDSGVAELGAANYTIAAWVKTTETGVAILSKSNGDTSWSSMEKQLYIADSATSEGQNDGPVEYVGYGCDWIRGSINVDDGQWHHVAVTWDNDATTGHMYVDGVEGTFEVGFNGGADNSGDTIRIGFSPGEHSNHFVGIIDDVRIYDHVLSEVEILGAMEGKAWPYATGPKPEDGVLLTNFPGGVLGYSLSWKPGAGAVSHDVYFGENFDDVNEGTGGTFRGNQTGLYFLAGYGYTPNDPAPTGFVPGTTYYWRIDEVNDLDPNSPWKGDVWSFEVADTKAYSPTPADGSKFTDPDVGLSWKPGLGVIMQTLYFGDDYDTVSTATSGGADVGSALTYDPGPLEYEKTYYWRVDTVSVFGQATGDVWSFTTARAGGGVKGQYYHHSGGTPDPPAMAFSTHVLTRTDPQINFNWDNSPDPSINDDNFAVLWIGEVEAAFTETYTFYTNSDDGVMLWIDGQLIVENWTIHPSTENKGTIDLVAGQQYSLEMWWFEAGGGAVAQLSWSSDSTPRQVIPQAALSPPIKASGPSPANGSTGVKMTPNLTWSAGDYAASHQVYFGTDEDAVRNATTSSPQYIGTRALGNESYDPGKLAWESTYYWRVDEVNNLNPDSPWKGNLWSFTTGDFLVVDNFEDYDAEDQIWYNWVDGLGYVKPDTPPHPGNGSGSEVGDASTTSFTEETIIHGGFQSMPFKFNNNDPFKLKYSEAKLTLNNTRDWTEESVKALSLWFQGYPASVGSFTDNFNDTYTMTGSGADIWNVGGVEADEFHFAYKTLTGAGTITARVDSVLDVHDWAKAGVMIRETLDPNSAHAFACVTPGSGVSFQHRPSTGGGSQDDTTGDITAPYWVRLERDLAGNFTVTRSADGSTWEAQGTLQNIPMTTNVYVGLAVTSHDPALTCEAAFSSVTITGNVTGQWASQDIGITSNDAEPLYVAIANNTGQPAVVVHDDLNASQINEWTEWNIDLSDFAGINLADVNSIAVGLGNRNNPQAGGAGKMYFDDFSLYRPRCVPDKLTLSEADLNSDCVVDFSDLEIMTGDWLAGDPGLAADLNADDTVDFKDYAVLADQWLEKQIWPDL